MLGARTACWYEPRNVALRYGPEREFRLVGIRTSGPVVLRSAIAEAELQQSPARLVAQQRHQGLGVQVDVALPTVARGPGTEAGHVRAWTDHARHGGQEHRQHRIRHVGKLIALVERAESSAQVAGRQCQQRPVQRAFDDALVDLRLVLGRRGDVSRARRGDPALAEHVEPAARRTSAVGCEQQFLVLRRARDAVLPLRALVAGRSAGRRRNSSPRTLRRATRQ